jgi:hypothetical protein
MKVTDVIQQLQATRHCRVLPPRGLPTVSVDERLPEDLQAFYQFCGGAILHEDSAFGLTIVGPESFVRANPKILVGSNEADLQSTKSDVSWHWYVVAEGEDAQFVTIDTSPSRLGRCYDSHWMKHPGNSVVIAQSFTQFLQRALNDSGDEFFWWREGSLPLATDQI